MINRTSLSNLLSPLWGKICIWRNTHRSSQAGISSDRGDNVKEISFENFFQIFEYDNSEDIREANRLDREFEKNKRSKESNENAKNSVPHPKNELVWRVARTIIGEHIYTPERAYLEHIKEKAREYGIEKNIIFEELSEGMSMIIGESKNRYRVKYKITIKNLTIKLGGTDLSLSLGFDGPKRKFNKAKEEMLNSNLTDKGGILFTFEQNSFVLSSPDTINNHLSWNLGIGRYLVLERNEFKSIKMEITTKGNSVLCLMSNYFNSTSIKSTYKSISIHGEPIMVVLAGNFFDDMPLRINGISDGESGSHIVDDSWIFSPGKKEIARRMEKLINRDAPMDTNKYIKNIEDKSEETIDRVSIKDILRMLLYMDKKITVHPDDLKYLGESVVEMEDNYFSELNIVSHKSYFGGKNIINNLEIDQRIKYLYWGLYQDIDPKGENAHNHKQIFAKLIECLAQNNDKILEAKLRREMLKCERILILEEKELHSLQDKFILWWGKWSSDYGISWLRPLLWITGINFFLASVVLCFLNPQSSLWLIFFEFFNPISNLSDVVKTEKNKEWFALINVLQKVFLAALYYEFIKIVRRFSK